MNHRAIFVFLICLFFVLADKMIIKLVAINFFHKKFKYLYLLTTLLFIDRLSVIFGLGLESTTNILKRTDGRSFNQNNNNNINHILNPSQFSLTEPFSVNSAKTKNRILNSKSKKIIQQNKAKIILKCPNECDCQGLSIDCSYRSLKTIPMNIPNNIIKLDLQGNNLTHLKAEELSYLKNLKVLHLQDNQIEIIENGSFDTFYNLERLRLNSNKIAQIPNDLFKNLKSLKRLDLSFNKIKSINRKLFGTLNNLNNLQLENNHISCIEKDSFNNLTKLDILRIRNNNLKCDCKLLWLSEWLIKNPNLAIETKCFLTSNNDEYEITKINEHNLNCNEKENGDGISYEIEDSCEIEEKCPFPCKCENNVMDCKDKSLKQIPINIPESIVELHLKRNLITEVPSKIFIKLRNLRLLDLSNNQIQKIYHDSFNGLTSLNTLILFRNELVSLPGFAFGDLSNLKFLLINANKISCLKKETFNGLFNLHLLSLFDNQLKTLPNGLFNNLLSIQTIHLGRNPLICDCKLRWLNEYFKSNPIERSGIACSYPKKLAKKMIGKMSNSRFRCNSNTSNVIDESCLIENKCALNCTCQGTIINCIGLNLYEIPENLPEFATELHLQNNNIKVIKSNGLFKNLNNLLRIDLRQNKIESIENGAFDGAYKLTDLFLNENKLTFLNSEMFSGLKNLKTLLLRANQLTSIRNSTFNNLESLRLLSLYDNKIKCIQIGTFDKLTSLSTLNLMSNPFVCNCNTKWLGNWLKNTEIAIGNPKCSSPISLRDHSLSALDDNKFDCNNIMEKTGDECTFDSKLLSFGANKLNECPKECSCANGIVRCSHSNLKFIPLNIPVNARELYLDSNEIEEIPDYINKLFNLEKLDLSSNRIKSIPSKAFSNLTKLDTLIISFNSIHCLNVDSLYGLKNLRMLSLYANELTQILNGSFGDLRSISHIAIGLNPLYCDCHLAWFSKWIKQEYVEPGIARCHGPSHLSNKLILTTPNNFFQCSNETLQPKLRCDSCNNCINNSTCIIKTNQTNYLNEYKCICQTGYYGERCEKLVDSCYMQPCKNQGECRAINENSYKCNCKNGWEGDNCEINVDKCKSSPCLNNGKCLNKIFDYICQCANGYTGINCESQTQLCPTDNNPCQNEGTCLESETNKREYRCICKSGFEGSDCSINTDDCLNHKCQFGICVDGISNYTCKCKDGFTGLFCDLTIPISMPLISSNSSNQKYLKNNSNLKIPCKDTFKKFCLNDGICYYNSIDIKLEINPKKFCKCKPGYAGERCEILIEVNFQNEESYLEFEPPELDKEFILEINLITDSKYGLIFYHGSKSKQHVAAELFDGQIRVSFDIGNTESSSFISYTKVNDKEEHNIQFIISGQSFSININRNEQRLIHNQGSISYLNVQDEPLYLGGVPNSVKDRITNKLLHVKNATSLKGCLSNIKINNILKDLNSAEYLHKIMPGCTINELCKTTSIVKCKNDGICKLVENNLNKDHTCICPKNFTGELCQLPQVVENFAISINNNHQSNFKIGFLKSNDIIFNKIDNHTLLENKRTIENKLNCGEEIINEFYHDNTSGCKSRRKIKTIKCNGKCERKQIKTQHTPKIYNEDKNESVLSGLIIGTNKKVQYLKSSSISKSKSIYQCCLPSKKASRKVKLICNDGSILIKDVEFIQKCSCFEDKDFDDKC